MFDFAEDFSIGLDKFGYASVTYAPEHESFPPPAAPTTTQDLSSTYYFVYNYQHFIHLVNKAILSASGNLKAKFTSPDDIELFNQKIGNAVAPWIDFESSTNRVFITADERVCNNENTAMSPTAFKWVRLKLVFNDRLYELFASLPFRLVSHSADVASLQLLARRACPWYTIRFISRYTCSRRKL